MSALVRLRAKENGVAFPTLASHDDLVRMARGYRQGIDLLRGWRRALVGEELIELLEGKLVLSLDGHDLQVSRVWMAKSRRVGRRVTRQLASSGGPAFPVTDCERFAGTFVKLAARAFRFGILLVR